MLGGQSAHVLYPTVLLGMRTVIDQAVSQPEHLVDFWLNDEKFLQALMM